MTTFRKSVSWSKFSKALTCPLMLQKTLEKEYSPKFGTTSESSARGKLVQKVFELYFNNGLNLQPNGRNPEVLSKIMNKILVSPWAKEEGIIGSQFYEDSDKEMEFRSSTILQLQSGLEILKDMGLLERKVRSEVDLKVTYKGFRMFGKLDFLIDLGRSTFEVHDGKGNVAMDADPRQVLYYGLMVHASNSKLARSGFIYWRHKFVEVDVSPEALHHFVHNDFERGRKIFERLKEGVKVLEANPSAQNCNWCLWKKNCTESYYRTESKEVLSGIIEIGL